MNQPSNHLPNNASNHATNHITNHTTDRATNHARSHSPTAISGSNNRIGHVDGFAMLSVLLIMVLLSITTVPLMDMVARNKKLAIEQQVRTHLNQAAKENLEIGIYLVKLANGIPNADYSLNSASMPAAVESMGTACTRRINVVDPEFLESRNLGSRTDPVWHNTITTNARRSVIVFMTTTGESSAYTKYIVVACARAENEAIGVFGAELVGVDGGFYTVSHGRF